MNQGHRFPKEDTSTRAALLHLLPKERCHLDGQVPYNPVRLPCGHSYCRLCLDDIVATATLVGRRPHCKACHYEFGALPRPFVRGTIGEQAGQLLEAIGLSSAPSRPLSQKVVALLEEYTKNEPDSQLSDDNAICNIDKVDYTVERIGSSLRGVLQNFQSEEARPPWRDLDHDSSLVQGSLEFPPNKDTYDGIEFFDFDLWEEPQQMDPVSVETKLNVLELKDGKNTKPEPIVLQNPTWNEQPLQLERDISVLAGERFCFKGTLQDQLKMEAAVKANGGNITGGGYKHTTYGVVGPGWKITRSWITNGVRILSEEGFWELLEKKKREREVNRMVHRGYMI